MALRTCSTPLHPPSRIMMTMPAGRLQRTMRRRKERSCTTRATTGEDPVGLGEDPVDPGEDPEDPGLEQVVLLGPTVDLSSPDTTMTSLVAARRNLPHSLASDLAASYLHLLIFTHIEYIYILKPLTLV